MMQKMRPQHNNMRQIGKCHKPQCNKNIKPMCQNFKPGCCLNKATICGKNTEKMEPPSPSTFKKIFGCQKEQKCDKLMKDEKVEPFPKKEEPCKLKEEK